MNLLTLMAGSSAAFAEAGYRYPRNLVEVNGLPLVQHVIRALQQTVSGQAAMITMVRAEEVRRWHIDATIRLLVPDALVVSVPDDTGGAACTALLAIEHLDNDQPLLLVNGDQILDVNLAAVVRGFQGRGLDGGIVVFEAVHPRWSFVRCSEDGLVVETAEKRPISNLATAGCYYFARSRDFVIAAQSMIRKDASVNGAFYICPVYNELVLQNMKIGIHKIVREQYASLATPQNVESYESRLAAR